MTDTVSAQVAKALTGGEPPADLSIFTEYLRWTAANPANYDSALVSRILLATLLRIGESDTVACLCLIPEKMHDAPEIASVLALEDKLVRGDYAGFWKLFENFRATAGASPAFDVAMRRAMSASLANTFASVDVGAVAAMLNITVGDVAKTIEPLGSVNGSLVVFAANEFNRPKPPPPPRDLSSANIAAVVRAA
jgi:hypothetical protein